MPSAYLNHLINAHKTHTHTKPPFNPGVLDGEEWTVHAIPRGQMAKIDKQTRTAWVPATSDPQDRATRLHELAHAMYTPSDKTPFQYAAEWNLPPLAVQYAEDIRINNLLQINYQPYRPDHAAQMDYGIPLPQIAAIMLQQRRDDAASSAIFMLTSYANNFGHLNSVSSEQRHELAHTYTALQKSKYLAAFLKLGTSLPIATALANLIVHTTQMCLSHLRGAHPANAAPARTKPFLPDRLDFHETTLQLARYLDYATQHQNDILDAKGNHETLESLAREQEEQRKRMSAIKSKLMHESRALPRTKLQHGKRHDFTDLSESDREDLWAPMATFHLALTERANPTIFHRARRRSGSGVHLKYAYRARTDARIFSRLKKKPSGGSYLIDASGSMSWNVDDLIAHIAQNPNATLALYSTIDQSETEYAPAGTKIDYTKGFWATKKGKVGEGYGALYVLAHGGMRASRADIRWACDMIGRGNGCDGLALRWLAKEPEPRHWFTDMGVTGRNGTDARHLVADVETICAINDITILNTRQLDRIIAAHEQETKAAADDLNDILDPSDDDDDE